MNPRADWKLIAKPQNPKKLKKEPKSLSPGNEFSMTRSHGRPNNCSSQNYI
jgi:hypothetical protein